MHNNRLYEQARFYLERSNLLESQLNETNQITEAILDELLDTLEDQVNFYCSLVEMRDYTTKERLANTPEGEALRGKLARRAERIRGLADRFNRREVKFHGSDSDDPSKRREGTELAALRISHMLGRLGDKDFEKGYDIGAGRVVVKKSTSPDPSSKSETVTPETPINLHSYEDDAHAQVSPDKRREYHGLVGGSQRRDARELGAKVKADKQKAKARAQLQVPGAVGKHAHEHVRDPESFGGLDAGEQSKDSRFSP